MNASENQPSGLGMRMLGRFRREIKKGEEKGTPGLWGGGMGSGRKNSDVILLHSSSQKKGRQALLSRKAGGGVRAGRASLWAKLLKEDVSEDSDAGRQLELKIGFLCYPRTREIQLKV